MKFYEGVKCFKWASGEIDDSSSIVWVLIFMPKYLVGRNEEGSRNPEEMQTYYAEALMENQGIALAHPAPSRGPGQMFASPPTHEVVGRRYLITQYAGYDV